MLLRRCVWAAVLLGGSAFGQTEFDIADVHVSAKTRHAAVNTSVRAGRIEIRMATMVDLIAAAYGVENDKVVGGPNWLELDRFDVIAKAPADTPQRGYKLMLQSLLASRFGLAVHPDSRPAAAFVLSAGRPKLKQSDGSGQAGCQRQAQTAEGEVGFRCRGLTMDVFAAQLRAAAGDYLMSPVVNNTQLAGAWDFSLQWTPRGALAAAGSNGVTIFQAIDSQLGLKLESKQMPMPVIVVDRVNRKPTETSLLPAPAPQFEVATIKATDPAMRDVRIQTPPNGQVSIQGVTLSFLMQTIWFITPEQMVNAPKWLDEDRWDIIAKVAAEPGSAPRTDMDSLIAMVRQLIEERFALKTHTEERMAPGFTLTASKPKMQKADPGSRSGCKEGQGANPALSRVVNCRNVTMAQFAELLPNIANALNILNGPIRSPVIDATGLDGAYDFTFSFTNGTPNIAPSSDPDGTISLADAISRDLGLKLEVKKRPAEVLVIDHIERKPSV